MNTTTEKITASQWLDTYDYQFESFKWFIKDYFGDVMLEQLNRLRRQGDIIGLFTTLNLVWFHLPDRVFNIMENPAGWSQFLSLVENPPED